MSGKWKDISTAKTEQYELLAPTERGLILRDKEAGEDTPYRACVAYNQQQRWADHSFESRVAAQIWVENEMAQILGNQVDA
jgi:hypothetical protein